MEGLGTRLVCTTMLGWFCTWHGVTIMSKSVSHLNQLCSIFTDFQLLVYHTGLSADSHSNPVLCVVSNIPVLKVKSCLVIRSVCCSLECWAKKPYWNHAAETPTASPRPASPSFHCCATPSNSCRGGPGMNQSCELWSKVGWWFETSVCWCTYLSRQVWNWPHPCMLIAQSFVHAIGAWLTVQ